MFIYEQVWEKLLEWVAETVRMIPLPSGRPDYDRLIGFVLQLLPCHFRAFPSRKYGKDFELNNNLVSLQNGLSSHLMRSGS